MEKGKKRAKSVWQNIKRRCYSPSDKAYKFYGAIGIKMCDEWLDFKNFEQWYLDNYYEVDGQYMAVDKDILDKDSKIYSPETCLIVPYSINGMFVCKDNGDMRGIQKRGKKYEVKVRNPLQGGENQYIGMYESVEVASKVYKQCKQAIIQGVAEEYRDRVPKKVYDALMNYRL